MDDPRDRLLQAAGEIFADKGYEKATVREICQAANVQNIAAVNYYFGDKERLYIEAVKRAHQSKIDEIPLPKWPPGTPAEERLHGFVATMIARFAGAAALPWHEQLMMREVANPTTAVVELVRQFIRPHFDMLMSCISELTPADMPLARRQQIAFSIVGQCLHYKIAKPIVKLLVGETQAAANTPEMLVEHITQFSLAAIRGLSSQNAAVKTGAAGAASRIAAPARRTAKRGTTG